MPTQWNVIYAPTTIVAWAIVVFVIGLAIHFVKHRKVLVALVNGVIVTSLCAGSFLILFIFGFWLYGKFNPVSREGVLLGLASLGFLGIAFGGLYFFAEKYRSCGESNN